LRRLNQPTLMLTPRLRRRLSELARTPAPPAGWTGVRGGVSAPSAPSSSPDPLSEEGPGVRACREAPAPDTQTLLLMPFDPAALGAETETELGRCFRITLAIGDHLNDAGERSQRVHAAAERMKLAPESLLFVDLETAGLAAAPLFLIG